MKKGFVSISLVYSILIIFIFLTFSIIGIYYKRLSYTSALKENIKDEFILDYSSYFSSTYSSSGD